MSSYDPPADAAGIITEGEMRRSMQLVRLQIATPLSLLMTIGANLVCALAIKPGLGELILLRGREAETDPVLQLISTSSIPLVNMISSFIWSHETDLFTRSAIAQSDYGWNLLDSSLFSADWAMPYSGNGAKGRDQGERLFFVIVSSWLGSFTGIRASSRRDSGRPA